MRQKADNTYVVPIYAIKQRQNTRKSREIVGRTRRRELERGRGKVQLQLQPFFSTMQQ